LSFCGLCTGTGTGTLCRPAWVPPHVLWVNRDELFPNPKDAPSFQSYSVYAVSHLIPGLAEKYILLDDDVIPYRDTRPSYFFQLDKPVVREEHEPAGVYSRCFWKGAAPGSSGCYAKESEKAQVPANAPKRSWQKATHQPMPLTKSLIRRFDKAYPGYLDFVRSHKHRFAWTSEELGMIYYEYWHSLAAIVHRPPPYGRLGMTAFSWPPRARITPLRMLRDGLDMTPSIHHRLWYYGWVLTFLRAVKFVNVNDNWSREPGEMEEEMAALRGFMDGHLCPAP